LAKNAIITICALINPPSKKHYNPSKNLHSQDTCVRLGIPVFPTDSNKNEHTSSKEQPNEEKWCSERSDLAAQWKTADIANAAFWAYDLSLGL